MIRKEKGITLISLIVTIIILLLLVLVTMGTFDGNGIIDNTETVAEQSRINEKKEGIELAIVGKMSKGDRDVTIETVIEELEKKGIINEGDSDAVTGQVKTQPDGYIYEIQEKPNGDWEVTYIGKGEIEKAELVITAIPNTVGVANQVTIVVTAKAESGIIMYTDAGGENKTYSSGTTEISETYDVVANGTYTFEALNSNGISKTATIEINNIIEEEIQMSASINTEDETAIVTVIWPAGSEKGIKEISIDGGETWKSYVGSSHEITVKENCTVKARVRGIAGEIKSASLTVVVEKEIGVYGTLYKISDGEYHLIFNSKGKIAEGYTKEQKVSQTDNIVKGWTNSNYKNQPWADYKNLISRVSIEDEIKPKSMGWFFYELSLIEEIENVSNINTDEVTNMNWMCYGCTNLKTLDLSSFNTGKVKYMRSMFEGCININNLDFSSFNTMNVTMMSNMFDGCSSLTSLDLTSFNTEKVTTMRMMFNGCSSLTSLKVHTFNTANVTDMVQMFTKCSMLSELDLTSFNTINVKDMYYMFGNCKALTTLDLSSFNTGKVENMKYMFDSCSSLTTIYVGDEWTTEAVTEGSSVFDGCKTLSGAISYDSSKIDITYANYTTGYLTYKASE